MASPMSIGMIGIADPPRVVKTKARVVGQNELRWYDHGHEPVSAHCQLPEPLPGDKVAPQGLVAGCVVGSDQHVVTLNMGRT